MYRDYTMFSVYLLELLGNRYYVGYTPTSRFEARMKEHFSGRGSKWCKRHSPKRIVLVKQVAEEHEARHQEDIECAEILSKLGWNACRGGLFNLASDVDAMPSWIVRPYFERKVEIDRAHAVNRSGFHAKHVHLLGVRV